jgi:hypothetical protein
LASRPREQGIRFQQYPNAFLRFSDPQALQQFADSLQPHHLIACAQKWLARLTFYFPRVARSLRYELSKLRAKGLVEKIPHSRRYRLLPEGYRLCASPDRALPPCPRPW